MIPPVLGWLTSKLYADKTQSECVVREFGELELLAYWRD